MGDEKKANDELAKLKSRTARSIASLRLDVKAAEDGKTWLLLPEGFRAQEFGYTYPLPTSRRELQLLAAVPIPPGKADSGCFYLRRALKKWRERASKEGSVLRDITRREFQLQSKQENMHQSLKKMVAEARNAVNNVKEEAEKATASLTTLFSLGRRGLEAQMQAYLDNKPYHGEHIDHKGFRDCFRMVTQAVKGLGLPSTERENAHQSILEEAAAAMKATQGALTEPEDDKVH